VTPVELLLETVRHGARLSINGDKLHVEPINRLTPAFVETLRDHKTQLLALLALPFVLVDSEAVGELLFFCEDDQTRTALIEAGAQDDDVIYTRDELQILIEHNRARPFVPNELIALHDAKKVFSAKVTRNDL
jgi:hypothetical protein